MGEGKRVGLVTRSVSKAVSGFAAGKQRTGLLDKVKHGNTITDGRDETSSIWGEYKIALAVDCAQEIRELDANVSREEGGCVANGHTLKSIFMLVSVSRTGKAA